MQAGPRSISLALVSLLAVLTLPPIHAQTASLVADLATGQGGSVSAWQITPAGSKIFFVGVEAGSGSELWVTDRTPNGTRLLVDFCPGPCIESLNLLGALGGILIFSLGDPDSTDISVWRSDGTRSGTFALTETFATRDRDRPFGGVFFGDAFFFKSCSDEGCELWRTDGTRAGTGPFTAAGSDPEETAGDVVAAAGRLFFLTNSPRGTRLWRSDGTPEGTTLVRAFRAAEFLTAARDRVYLMVHDEGSDLWTSDGSSQGTYPVTSFLPVQPFDLLWNAFWREVSGNLIYFKANDIVHGEEIWMSDGSRSGARRITDLAAQEPFGSTLPRVTQDRVIFTATDGFSGFRLGSTTGDPASTTLLPASDGSWYGIRLAAARDRVYFVHYDSEHGREVWTSDGTTAGTRLIKDVCEGRCDGVSHEARFVETPFGVVFLATDSRGIKSVWKSDGTPRGTQPLAEIAEPFSWWSELAARLAGDTLIFFTPSPQGPTLWKSEQLGEPQPIVTFGLANASSFPRTLTAVQNRLYFVACDETTLRLWQTEGTPATTAPVFPELSAPCFASLADPLIPVGPRLLLWADLGAGVGLWAIDGTPAGTTLVLNGVSALGPDTAVVADRLYFRVFGREGTEIWRTDGTPAGTARLTSFPGEIPASMVAVGTDLFFLASGQDGTRLWRFATGTALLHDLGPVDLPVREGLAMERLGSKIVFTSDLKGGGALGALWITDGTLAGTGPLFGQDEGISASDLTRFQGALYFLGGTGFWRTDGTTGGTRLVRGFDSSAWLSPLTATTNRLFFVVHHPFEGRRELWTSDGTPAGTTLFRTLPERHLEELPEILAVGDRLFFQGHDATHGVELWETDGTARGTRMVQDIAPEASSSQPRDFIAAGQRLYFTADDGRAGRELWVLPLTGPAGCQPSSTRLCLNGGRFQVEADWRDFQGNTGVGTAVPLTADTGYFWFFDPDNAEVILKVLDGRGLNDHFWVFYGALSSVEYSLTVTDTQTGLSRRYLNPAGQLASLGDTHGFGPLGAFSASPEPFVAPSAPPALVSARTVPAAATGSCQPGPRRLCVNGRRFAVEASWKDFQGNTGAGTAVPLTPDTGYFWFFDAANIEVLLKVLDGTPLNGRFWVFYGALSNVEYTLTVTDTHTGAVKEYRNPSGRFASVADTGAF